MHFDRGENDCEINVEVNKGQNDFDEFISIANDIDKDKEEAHFSYHLEGDPVDAAPYTLTV